MRQISLFLLLSASWTVSAAPVTGDPSADGWTLAGNSLTVGTFVRGTGGQNFDVYFTQFLLDAANPLLGPNWLVGDQIIGLGGVVQTLVDETARVVIKWGTAGNTFSAAPSLLPCASTNTSCGNGSFSGGNGGVGSILAGFVYARTNNTLNTPGWNGGIVTPSVQQRYSPPDDPLAGDFTRIISLFDTAGPDMLSSFQGFLNVSEMQRAGVTNLPILDTNHIVTIQRGASGVVVDALVTGSSVPEPGTWALSAAGMIALLAFAKKGRRRPSSGGF